MAPHLTDKSITVIVEEHLAEIVVDRMWQWGVQAIGQTQRPDGMVEIFTSVGNERASIGKALETLEPSWRWEVRDVDASVNAVAPEHLSPTRFLPDMVSVPASIADTAETGSAHVTIIEAGSAFGLGDHPTTRSSMKELALLLQRGDRPVTSLLDVGCGSGALSVLAAQLGVPTIRAIDIADAAVEATLRTAELNGVEGAITVDTTPIDELTGQYDVIVANILAPVLVSMAHDLRRLLAPAGRLIVSGLLEERHEHVLEALEPLEPDESTLLDGWITILLCRPGHRT